jgi:hypothetical protein
MGAKTLELSHTLGLKSEFEGIKVKRAEHAEQETGEFNLLRVIVFRLS